MPGKFGKFKQSGVVRGSGKKHDNYMRQVHKEYQKEKQEEYKVTGMHIQPIPLKGDELNPPSKSESETQRRRRMKQEAYKKYEQRRKEITEDYNKHLISDDVYEKEMAWVEQKERELSEL